MESNAPDIRRKESTAYSILERLSVAVGLLALVPLTRIWDRPWWLRNTDASSPGGHARCPGDTAQ